MQFCMLTFSNNKVIMLPREKLVMGSRVVVEKLWPVVFMYWADTIESSSTRPSFFTTARTLPLVPLAMEA